MLKLKPNLSESARIHQEQLVVTKAVLRAGERLGMPAKLLAKVIGLSEASISRIKRGGLTLESGTKAFELSVLLIRLFRSLDAITGGEDSVARQWLLGENIVLGGRPIDLIQTISGLFQVIAYLDARRARV